MWRVWAPTGEQMHQSPPICPTDAPGASTGQGAGGWPPSGRCGTQARCPPGPEAGLWGSQTSLDAAHPPTSRFGMTIERKPAYGQSRPRVRKARRIQCAQGEERRKQTKETGASPRLGSRRRYLAVEPAQLNAQSTLRQWAFGVCSTGVARARGGAHAQCIALLAH